MFTLGILTNAPALGPEPFGKETRYFTRLIVDHAARGGTAYAFSVDGIEQAISVKPGQGTGVNTNPVAVRESVQNSVGNAIQSAIPGFIPTGDCAWRESACPWPDVIYDRLIPRDPPSALRVSAIGRLLEEHGAQFINSPRFISLMSNKWLVHRTLLLHREVAGNLARTEYYSRDSLERLIHSRGSVYIKPVTGHQSRGLIHVVRSPAKTYRATRSLSGRRIESSECSSLDSLLAFIDAEASVTAGGQEYLVQEPIDPAMFLGKRFEIRVMMHKDGRGVWLRTGMVVRAAASDLDFLAPGLERHFRPSAVMPKVYGRSSAQVLDSVRALVRPIPRILESHSGPGGEIAVDVILDRSGKPWLLEVNSRPASLFLNVGAMHLRNRGLERILDYAGFLASSVRPPE